MKRYENELKCFTGMISLSHVNFSYFTVSGGKKIIQKKKREEKNPLQL